MNGLKTLVALLFFPGVAMAGHPVVQQQYAQAVASQVYYFVGAPVRVEAMRAADAEYQEFLRFKQWQEQLKQDAPSSAETPVPQAAVTQGAIKQHCGKCHGSPTEGNNFYQLSGDSEIEALVAMQALKAIRSGEMPKGKDLSSAEGNAVLDELIALTKGL